MDHGFEDIVKSWNLPSLIVKDPKEEESRLSKVFETAVKNGADPKVLANILNDWREQYIQYTQMGRKLHDYSDKDNPDAFQDFVNSSRDNVAKGMHILTDKTNDFVKQAQEGKINGNTLTEKIKGAHQKVISIFHEKQSELSNKFKEFVSGIKVAVREVNDVSRLNSWIKAVEANEALKLKLQESKEDKIADLAEKIQSQTDKQLEKNLSNFDKKIANYDQPTFSKRIGAGLKTITDAIQGKEYKEYSATTSTKEASDALIKAKADLEKADNRAKIVGKFKLEVVKAWANLSEKFNQFRANHYEKLAELTESRLNDIESPELKSYSKAIQENLAKGMGIDEAMKAIRDTDNRTVDTVDKSDKDIDIPDKSSNFGDFDR